MFPRTPTSVRTRKRVQAKKRAAVRTLVSGLTPANFPPFPRRFPAQNIRTAGFLGIEKKFYDTSLAAGTLTAPIDSTGGEQDPTATSMISTPAQGDSEQNRNGKRINILQCNVTGNVQWPLAQSQTIPPTNAMIYIALVLDTQSNAAQMNSEDCFKNTAADADAAANPVRNLLFAQRFRVLRKKRINLNLALQPMNEGAAALFAWAKGFVPFDFLVKWPKGLPVNFNAGTTASIANVIDNSLHIIAFSTSTGVNPVITYNARIRFVG